LFCCPQSYSQCGGVGGGDDQAAAARYDSLRCGYDARKMHGSRRRRSLMPPTSHNDIMSTVTPSGAAILV